MFKKNNLFILLIFACMLTYLGGNVFAVSKNTTPKTNVTTNKKTTQKQQKISIEKTIAKYLENVPRIFYIIPELDKAKITKLKNNYNITDFTSEADYFYYEYDKIMIDELNERIPGNYSVYSVNNKLYCYVENNTNKIYIENDGIFSLPDYKIVVPIFNKAKTFSFNRDDDVYYNLIASLVIRDKKLSKESKFLYDTHRDSKDDYKLYVKVTMEDGIGDHYIGTYMIDTVMRTVTDQKTKKVLYDDSAVMKYPETFITEKQAGEMAAKILRKLKILGANQRYYVTDVKETTDDNNYLVEGREGYFLTIRIDNPKNPEIKELLGNFFINNTSTVMMKYYVVEDLYEYIYGKYTPFG